MKLISLKNLIIILIVLLLELKGKLKNDEIKRKNRKT